MCGICGYLTVEPAAAPSLDALRTMTRTMTHRGPDEEGYYRAGPCGLGMRRLRIIDINTGSQPVYNEDHTVCVVLNGEIYNYVELRADLEARGHRFSTASDTEVLVHLYEEHGTDLCVHLNGMFAFALWDEARRRLLVARDRMGQKPLFYYHTDRLLVFGSELKALRACPDVPARLDPVALCLYLIYEYVPTPMSIYEGFRKLGPGHLLIVDCGRDRLQLSDRQYWSLVASVPTRDVDMPEAAERFSDLLDDAVRIRMRADVPYGAFLSGGIDSSAVTATMVRCSSRPVHTFSIGFSTRGFDESPWSTLVARYLGTRHHLHCFSTDDALDVVESVPDLLDEPMGDASILPTCLLSRFARESVTLALGGDGGDELMAGYPTYFCHRAADRIPSALARDLGRCGAALTRLLPVRQGNLDLGFKVRRFVSGLGMPLFRRNTNWMGSLPLDQLPRLVSPEVLTPEVRQAVEDFIDFKAAEARAPGLDSVAQAMRYDQRGYMMDEVLVKVDRASMAASLEVRAPLLDYRIVEYLNSLPTRLKLRGGTGKLILKHAMRDRLPDAVLHRPKRGFAIPVARWLRGRLRGTLDEYMSPRRLAAAGLFSPAFVQTMVDQHTAGRADNRKLLWTLLVFHLWLARWL